MKKRGNNKGYTLIELLVVITIIAIFSAVSTGFYRGYVERARTAKYYELAHQIRQALTVCEMEYGDEYGLTDDIYMTDEFFLLPNDPDSVLYPYVGDSTDDCTDFSLRLERNREVSGNHYRIAGFTYETEGYTVRWTDPDTITVDKK